MRLSLVALIVAGSAQASVTLTYTQTADNAAWPSAPAAYNGASYEFIFPSYDGRTGYGFYDAFQITAQGDSNASVGSLSISFRFSGYFDDSVGVDLNGDGTIDYALSYFSIASTYNNYQPWISLVDARSLGVRLTITTTGTTAEAFVYGQAISNTGFGYLNNLSGITLSTLGLATLDAGGSAVSTQSIRIGFLNVDGNGGGSPTISSANFGSVPEPSTYGLAFGGLALALVALRRRQVRA